MIFEIVCSSFKSKSLISEVLTFVPTLPPSIVTLKLKVAYYINVTAGYGMPDREPSERCCKVGLFYVQKQPQ